VSTAYEQARHLRGLTGAFCIPCEVHGTGPDKHVQPWVAWADLYDSPLDDAEFERVWTGREDAPGLAMLLGPKPGFLAFDADTLQAEAEWIRRLPRTVAWRSTRGPKWLLRWPTGNGSIPSGSNLLGPGFDVLGDRHIVVLPPTQGRTWLPSQGPEDAPVAWLPDAELRRLKAVERPKTTAGEVPDIIPEGSRETAMVSLAGSMRRRGFSAQGILAALRVENAARCLPPLEDRDLERIAASVGRYEPAGNQVVNPADNQVEGDPPPAGEVDPSRYFGRDGFQPSVLGSEVREAHKVRVGEGRRLYWYRDGVFRGDGRDLVEKLTRELLGERYRKRHAEEVLAWCRAEFAQIPTEPGTDLLNVRNGMLDWRTGELHPHSPEHGSIIQIPVAWTQGAACPTAHTFLGEVLPEDAVDLAYELIGYMLLPAQPLRKAVLLLGPGSNGKSTFMAMCRRLLGRRNVSSVPLQAFGESRFAAAEVYGKLANLCGDLDARALRRSDLFKTVTGGTDEVMAERKYEHPFSYVPYATLVFSANEAPASTDQTDAFFDRWIVLPFDRRFTDDADPHLLAKLTTREELEGLLVRAVSGLADLMDRGFFDLPESVRSAGQEYREKLDTVATFIEEGCVVSPTSRCSRGRMYEAYREWCGRNGRLPVSQQSFAPRVRQKLLGQVEEARSHDDRVWVGVGLRA
jgi:P4 family phage/plasmid primase-like protien